MNFKATFSISCCVKTAMWPIGNPDRETIWLLRLDEPQYSADYLHDAAKHILAQKSKFSRWFNSDNPEIMANALLILCLRENKILQAQIKNRLENFRMTGDFTENMTVERLEARKTRATESGAPACPKCGKPMLKRMQKKGQGQGREFWGGAATTRTATAPDRSILRPLRAPRDNREPRD